MTSDSIFAENSPSGRRRINTRETGRSGVSDNSSCRVETVTLIELHDKNLDDKYESRECVHLLGTEGKGLDTS